MVELIVSRMFFLNDKSKNRTNQTKYNLHVHIGILQEDFNDMDGGAPVTSQPAPGPGTSSNVSIPMAGNPTNPFNLATEQTSLNTTEQATYTPGK